MVDYARVSDEQILTDVRTAPDARVSDVVVLVEWIPIPPPYDVKLLAERAVVEWEAPSAGELTSEVGFVEWAPPGTGILLSDIGFVEWETGGTMTMEGARLVLRATDATDAYGIEHRELADMALAEIEMGGGRGTNGPGTPGGTGEGFPLGGEPPASGSLGIARYPAPNSDPTWEAS